MHKRLIALLSPVLFAGVAARYAKLPLLSEFGNVAPELPGTGWESNL